MNNPPANAAPNAQPAAQPAAHATAGRWLTAWIVLLSVTFGGLVADLASKHWAFQTIAGAPVVMTRDEVIATSPPSRLIPFHQPRVIIPNLLEFTLVLNPGAVFGMGAGKRWFFIVVTLFAIGFGLWIFKRWTTARDHAAHAAIGLLLSGGLGNLYDRLLYACVRDFIHPLPGIRLPFGWSWPWGGRDVWPYVSNVADLFLLIGIGMLLVYSWTHSHQPLHPARASSDERPGAS